MFDINLNDISDDITKTARDAVYVAIGLGVMSLQRAQVRRRELVELAKQQIPAFEAPFNEARAEVQRRAHDLEGLFNEVAAKVELAEARAEVARRAHDLDELLNEVASKVELRLQPVETRLPESAQAFLGQAREAGTQLRHYILSALAA